MWKHFKEVFCACSFWETPPVWGPAEVKGDPFRVSAPSGDAETAKFLVLCKHHHGHFWTPPAPRPHWSRASPNVALLLLSSLSHQFHPYTGVGDRQDRVVTGTPSPAPFPGRAGADMGGTPGTLEGWGPLSTLTPQGFKNEVTGGLCKKRRGRFLSHFCYNTRRARHGLEEWDILILRLN